MWIHKIKYNLIAIWTHCNHYGPEIQRDRMKHSLLHLCQSNFKQFYQQCSSCCPHHISQLLTRPGFVSSPLKYFFYLKFLEFLFKEVLPICVLYCLEVCYEVHILQLLAQSYKGFSVTYGKCMESFLLFMLQGTAIVTFPLRTKLLMLPRNKILQIAQCFWPS